MTIDERGGAPAAASSGDPKGSVIYSLSEDRFFHFLRFFSFLEWTPRIWFLFHKIAWNGRKERGQTRDN